jgi:hypothetical protein
LVHSLFLIWHNVLWKCANIVLCKKSTNTKGHALSIEIENTLISDLCSMNGRTVGSELTALERAFAENLRAGTYAGGGGVGQYARNVDIPIRESR